jgi:hypothetical protein
VVHTTYPSHSFVLKKPSTVHRPVLTVDWRGGPIDGRRRPKASRRFLAGRKLHGARRF